MLLTGTCRHCGSWSLSWWGCSDWTHRQTVTCPPSRLFNVSSVLFLSPTLLPLYEWRFNCFCGAPCGGRCEGKDAMSVQASDVGRVPRIPECCRRYEAQTHRHINAALYTVSSATPPQHQQPALSSESKRQAQNNLTKTFYYIHIYSPQWAECNTTKKQKKE